MGILPLVKIITLSLSLSLLLSSLSQKGRLDNVDSLLFQTLVCKFRASASNFAEHSVQQESFTSDPFVSNSREDPFSVLLCLASVFSSLNEDPKKKKKPSKSENF